MGMVEAGRVRKRGRERGTKEDRSTRRKMEREMVARELNKSEN